MSEEIKTIGQIAYEAYAAHSGGCSLISGEPLPSWDEQREDIRDAWQAAALAVQAAPAAAPDGDAAVGAQTGMRLHEGHDWIVRPDMRPGDEERGENPDAKYFTKFERDAHTGQQIAVATLRRTGWLDQKGRVWTKIPPFISFDGGSLTPLLIDAREGGR